MHLLLLTLWSIYAGTDYQVSTMTHGKLEVRRIWSKGNKEEITNMMAMSITVNSFSPVNVRVFKAAVQINDKCIYQKF